MSNNDFNLFMSKNHLYGQLNTSIRLGLLYNNDLVSVIGFNKKKNYYEITRFANRLGYSVVGAASKLFKHFLNNYNPGNVMTYADRRYSDGGLYYKLGFNLLKITRPNYFYINHDTMYSRHKFQKHKLYNKLKLYDCNLSECENMFINGYRRLWDAGHLKFYYH